MKVLVLDGEYSHAVAIAGELKRELHPLTVPLTVIGAGRQGSILHTSRYCDVVEIIDSSKDGYSDNLYSLSQRLAPDFILPVGFSSHKAVIEIRHKLPPNVRTMLPKDQAFRVAVSKQATYSMATSLGIRVPADLTEAVMSALTPDSAHANLDFPIFLKSKEEVGGLSTALATSDSELKASVALIEQSGSGYLAQEYVGGDGFTYAVSALLLSGQPLLTFQHRETRSVPRYGGSGTRVATFHSAELEAIALKLLGHLDWTGVAQVEFKRNEQGQWILMEINPKFWASYALASRAGYSFAANLVSVATHAGVVRERRTRKLEMAFPFRELRYVMQHPKQENLKESLWAMFRPPVVWDIDLRDFRPYLTQLTRAVRNRR